MLINITFANQANQILRQASLILTSILLVKSGISVENLGVFESLMYISTTVSFFWLNAILQGILMQYPSVQEPEKPIFRFNIFLLTLVFTVIILLMFTFFEKEFILLFTGQNNLPHFRIFKLYILFNLPPYLLESFWTVDNQPRSLFYYAILSHTLLPLSILLPIVLGWGFEASVYGMGLVALVRFAWLLNRVAQPQFWHFDKKWIRPFVMMCLPLVGYAFLSGFSTAFSNWLVNWWHSGDKSSFAIYRMGAREFPLSLALATGLSGAVVPILASSKVDFQSLSILKRKTTRLWHILFPSSIILMWSSKWLFLYVFNADYLQSAAIFNTYLLILLSRILFPQSILMALKQTNWILKISIIETIFIVVFSFVFAHFYGMLGIAMATVLGFLLEKLIMAFCLQTYFNISFSSYTDIKLYIFYAFLLIISFVLTL